MLTIRAFFSDSCTSSVIVPWSQVSTVTELRGSLVCFGTLIKSPWGGSVVNTGWALFSVDSLYPDHQSWRWCKFIHVDVGWSTALDLSTDECSYKHLIYMYRCSPSGYLYLHNYVYLKKLMSLYVHNLSSKYCIHKELLYRGKNYGEDSEGKATEKVQIWVHLQFPHCSFIKAQDSL